MKFETIKADRAMKLFRDMERASKGAIEFNPSIEDGNITSVDLHVERHFLKIGFTQYGSGLKFSVPEEAKVTVWRVHGRMFGLRFSQDFPDDKEMLAREWAEKLQEFKAANPNVKVERLTDVPVANTNPVRLPDSPQVPEVLGVYEDDDLPF